MKSTWTVCDVKSLSHLTAASPMHRHTSRAVDTTCVVWQVVQSSAVTTLTALTVLNTGSSSKQHENPWTAGNCRFCHFRLELCGRKWQRHRDFVQSSALEPDTLPVTRLKTAGPTSGCRYRMLTAMNVSVQFSVFGTVEHLVPFMYLIMSINYKGVHRSF
jgi:hypothetical protein